MKFFSNRACLWGALLAGLNAVTAGSTLPVISSFSITWSKSTPTPQPTDGYAAGVIGGRLVMVGGTYWEGVEGHWTRKIFSNATMAFDPKTGIWEKLPDAPVALGYAAGVSTGNELLVIGGMQNGAASPEIFVLRNTGGKFVWKHFGQLPEPRVFANAVVVDHTLFVLGGTSEYEPFDAAGTCCTSLTAKKTVWAMDLTRPDSPWRTVDGYPGDLRWLHKAATDGKSIYLFGGIYQASEKSPPKKINEVLRFDVASERWSRLAGLPEELQLASTVAVRGELLLIGSTTKVARFDPKSSVFSTLAPLPERASISQFVWIDPYLVGAGGENEAEGPRRRSDWTFVGGLNDTIHHENPGAHTGG